MSAETRPLSQMAPIEVPLEAGKTCCWCACGRSKSQPFCDGSHRRTSFTPLKFEATQAGRKWFCVCKQTQNPPFCYGQHAREGISK